MYLKKRFDTIQGNRFYNYIGMVISVNFNRLKGFTIHNY